MRKLILVSILLMMNGCTSNENLSASKSSNTTNEVSPTSLIHDEVMAGNFSSIKGEYVNPNGNSFILDDKGIVDEGEEFGKIEFNKLGDQYFINIHTSDGCGVQMTIYNIGSEVIGYVNTDYEVIDSDTTKIRITIGQSSPSSKDEIYTKK